MFGFLLVLLVLDGILLSVIVLLQSGKGGGLAAMGGGAGTDTLIGGRQAATLLTKATWIAGGIFLGLALVLSVMSSRSQRPDSLLRGLQPTAPAAAPAPVQIPGTQPQTEGTQATPQPGTQTAPQTGVQPAPQAPATDTTGR